MNEFELIDGEQAVQAPAIALDDLGMVGVNDPELLKRVGGAGPGNPIGGGIGSNDGCGWKMK